MRFPRSLQYRAFAARATARTSAKRSSKKLVKGHSYQLEPFVLRRAVVPPLYYYAVC